MRFLISTKTLEIVLITLTLNSCVSRQAPLITYDKILSPPKCDKVVDRYKELVNLDPPQLPMPSPNELLSILECIEKLELGYEY